MNVRFFITTTLEMIGMVLIVAGFGLISLPLALISSGICLAAIGRAQS